MSKIPEIICIKKSNLQKMGYSDLEDWLKNPNHLYIGRKNIYVKGAEASKWQNSFSVEKFGREKCLELYKEHIKSNKKLMGDINELNGKILGCWCKPEGCHGDILIELFKCQGN
jgi:hypothetical protein